ncbi:MATE family efflux transporter [Hominisplanchenecus murintestinalis]|uniref:MATE family efflux transporter n=1 Tax=Hominisplanchenecus murintestinalis TaxID=2941517 RepID=A0AC61R1Q2_9FIRM|nr:MATE family efflux transporter [Hominisplanchenecus murintestinalis]TGY00267.1 MATE family efflux transporter [Hominisplanchenecus murintestinalis]
MKNHDFHKKLLSLVLPIAFQQFMLSLVGASDAIMLGMISQEALSAVSLAGQMMFVFNLFLTAFAMGTSMLAAQYWGKGDSESVAKILAFVLRTSLAVSLIFCFGTLLFPRQVMRFFTSEQSLIDGGITYLQVSAVSYLMCGISQIYLCIMKNTGHAAKSTLISSTAVVLNLGLNAILVFGLYGAPAMGIAGAALATVIARGIEMVWAVLDSRKPGRIRWNMHYFIRPDKVLLRTYWKYSLPILGNQLAWGCGFTMYSVVMGHMGSDAVAANSIANIVKNLMVCFCIGIGNGGSILVGHELGAGRLKQAREAGRNLCRLAVISGIITGLLLLAVSPLILRFAALSSQAEEYLKWMFIVCSYYLVGKSINTTTIGGIFSAGGDTRFGLICDTVTLWCVTVPLGFIAAFILKWPVLAVYFVLNLDEIVKLPVVYKHYKKYSWVKNLTQKDESQKKDSSKPIVCSKNAAIS